MGKYGTQENIYAELRIDLSFIFSVSAFFFLQCTSLISFFDGFDDIWVNHQSSPGMIKVLSNATKENKLVCIQKTRAQKGKRL